MLNLNNSAISVTTIFYRIRNNSVDLFEVGYAIGRGFPNDFNKGGRLATSLICAKSFVR